MLYWITLIFGILLVVISLLRLGRVGNNVEHNSTQKDKLENNSRVLLAEVIEELHDNTERIVERFSKREKKLEMLLDQADRKIEELNYQLQKRPLTVQTKQQNNEMEFDKEEKQDLETEEVKNVQEDGKVLNFPAYPQMYSEIKNLYKAGNNITQIAKHTGKTKGEIQLILNLVEKSEELNENGMGC